MDVIEQGNAKIISRYDPEEHRRWVLNNKSRGLEDKRMGIEEAVKKYVDDGAYLFLGFFGAPISTVGVYEVIRQSKKNLKIGRGGIFEMDVLIGAGLVEAVDRGYGGGFEVRGLSPLYRRYIESGNLKVYEWSNIAFAWRLKAGAMGVPFLPTRVMMGTDTFKFSAAKTVQCPFTGMKVCLVPACFPDVTFVHVDRCDKYGNSQLDRISIMDVDAAKASRRVIITTEEVVETDKIRTAPWRTSIPFYAVDAVVEAPWGAHPSNMPEKYYMDEEFVGEWMSTSKTPEGTSAFLKKYVYGVKSFEEYLELIGGVKKLAFLKRLEELREPLPTPWKSG